VERARAKATGDPSDPPCSFFRVKPESNRPPAGCAPSASRPSSGVGSSSTRPSATSGTPAARGETGVDTLRLLFETSSYVEGIADLGDGWRFGSIPSLGLTWAEGHPLAGGLGSPDEVAAAGRQVRELVDDRLGVRADRGVARLDVTSTRVFNRPGDARAFLAGMAALELPRCETTRRGTPVHSISWTHAQGRRKLARCYDKGLERGGEAFHSARLEDQGRFAAGARPPVDVAAELEFQRQRFVRRFAPMRKAVDGVKAASFPVVAQALADEVRYGFRSAPEARALAGSLVLLRGGAAEGIARRTRYRWQAQLRDAGFVVVEDFMEPVEVNLGDELEAALEEFGA
jgi:hypothetical protein